MKKSQQLLKTLVLTLGLSTLALSAQAPQKMNYQALVRNSSNALLSNANVGVRVSVLQGSATGNAVYSETHTAKTNVNGLLNVEIGTGNGSTGDFSKIDWSKGPYFIKNEIDPLGGSAYSLNNTSQMMSVPYALYAANGLPKANAVGDTLSWNGTEWTTVAASASTGGKTYIILQGNISDAQAAKQIADEYGPNTAFVWVRGTTQLTTLDLSAVKTLIGLTIENNASLKDLKLTNLTQVFDQMGIENNNSLSSLDLPALTSVAEFGISRNNALLSLGLPSLTTVSGKANIDNKLLSTLSLPKLTTVNGLYIGGYFSTGSTLANVSLPLLSSFNDFTCVSEKLTSLEFPALSTGGTCSISSPVITKLDFPQLTKINTIRVSAPMPSVITTGTPIVSIPLTVFNVPKLSNIESLDLSTNNLSSLDLPALKTFFSISCSSPKLSTVNMPMLTSEIIPNTYGKSVELGSALPSSQVNALLAKFVAINQKSGSINLTQNPAAAPTGQGLADKAKLIAAGVSVTTN
jgi:hypothetical protein